MNRKIIIVEGYLAAGKSAFTRQLSAFLKIPYFVKDTFKTALCSSIIVNNRGESSLFSAITFDAIMYSAERLIEVGCPVIIEGNFAPMGVKKVDDSAKIRELIDKYCCKALTYKFKGDTQILYKRFIVRNDSPERGNANKEFEELSYQKFYQYCRNLDSFNIGGDIIEIDTTDFSKVDFKSLIDKACEFIDT